MSKPIVEFWVKEDNEWKELDMWDLGDIDAGDESEPKRIYIWNNRNGDNDVPDMINCRITTRNINGEKEGEPIEDKWVRAKIEHEEEYVPIGGDEVKYVGTGEAPDMLSEDRDISGLRNDGTLEDDIEIDGELMSAVGDEYREFKSVYKIAEGENITVYVDGEEVSQDEVKEIEGEEPTTDDGVKYKVEYDIVEDSLDVYVDGEKISSDNTKKIEKEELNSDNKLNYETDFIIDDTDDVSVYLNEEEIVNSVLSVEEELDVEENIAKTSREFKEDSLKVLVNEETIDSDNETKIEKEELESKDEDGFVFETKYDIKHGLKVYEDDEEIESDSVKNIEGKELESDDSLVYEFEDKIIEDSIEVFVDGNEKGTDDIKEYKEYPPTEDNLVYELTKDNAQDSVTVFVAEEEVEEGYTYNSEENTVVFEEETEDVEVSYYIEDGFEISYSDNKIVFDNEQEDKVTIDYKLEDGFNVDYEESTIEFDKPKSEVKIEADYEIDDGFELQDNQEIIFDIDKEEEKVEVEYNTEVKYEVEDDEVVFEEEVVEDKIEIDYDAIDGYVVDEDEREIIFDNNKEEENITVYYEGKDGYEVKHDEGKIVFDKEQDENDPIGIDYIGVKEQNYVPLDLKCKVPKKASNGNHQFYTRVSYQFTD